MSHEIDRRTFLQRTSMGAVMTMGLGFLPASLCAAGKKEERSSIEASLELLNVWGEKSKEVNDLYTAMFKVLSQKQDATFADVAQDATIQTLFQSMGLTHLGGPLLGCITPDSVKIWIRTTKPAEVDVQIEEEGKRRTFGPVRSTLESDLTAIVAVTGLKPGTSTKYSVRVDGKEIPLSSYAMIVTPPAGGEAETRIAFGTCPHRKGLGNPEQAEQILKFKPHAMLIYGDIAVQDRGRHVGLHRADYALREFHPAWKDLASRVPFSASWDDHDYCNNDGFGINSNFTDADRRQVRKVFAQAWNNPYYGMGDEGGGIFTHTRVGCCDVIMTDNRYFREKVEKGSAGKKNGFLGPQQMEWLKKTLLACKGPFIIVTCGTMWDDVAAKGKDSWGIYDPEGREEIYKFIEKNKIPGVLFLSGDRHGARIFRIPRPAAGHEFYEFEVATLGGLRSITAATNPEWKTQLFGQMSMYAHGQFTFDLSGDDPTVTHRLIQSDGQTLFELVLKRSQLTPK